jgi:hypothetical protein
MHFVWGFLTGCSAMATLIGYCVLTGVGPNRPAPEPSITPVPDAYVQAISMPENCIAKITYLDPNQPDRCVAWRRYRGQHHE